jgi:hypothetical protein
MVNDLESSRGIGQDTVSCLNLVDLRKRKAGGVCSIHPERVFAMVYSEPTLIDGKNTAIPSE